MATHGVGRFQLHKPEVALSPPQQPAFLQLLRRLTASREAHFVIAAHSPTRSAFPGATVLSLDNGVIEQVDYRSTQC